MVQSYLYEMIEKAEVSLHAHGISHHSVGKSGQIRIRDFDVLYVLSGKMCFCINGVEYLCKPGDVLVVAPNSQFSVRCDEPADQFYCHFDIKVQSEYKLTGSFRQNRLPESCSGLAKLCCEQIKHIETQGLPLGPSVRMIFKLFLIEMLQTDAANHVSFVSVPENEKPEELFAVLAHISEHLNENLSVEELAKMAGFHPSYFSRYFKRYMGMSPIRYINEHKMSLAKHLVSTTERPIKEIAAQLGFADQFGFSKKFKACFGSSPSEFRKIKI